MNHREVVGYTTYIGTNFMVSSKTTPYKRIVISNGAGKKVQITGWKDQKDKLKDVISDGTVSYKNISLFYQNNQKS